MQCYVIRQSLDTCLDTGDDNRKVRQNWVLENGLDEKQNSLCRATRRFLFC
jgi:hypothetical protein